MHLGLCVWPWCICIFVLLLLTHRFGSRLPFPWVFRSAFCTTPFHDSWSSPSAVDELQELPFWGHFAVVAIAQYHTVLFLVLLSNGLSYVLGICEDAGYMGLNRGILWWPIADPGNPCEL